MKITIGQTAQDKPFILPQDLVTSTVVVYGGKGMGKTNLASVLVEQLSANELRWAAIDPLGVCWGLRYSADGKGKGIECLILGGARGDIPIEPTGGAVVADLVVDETANVLVDISRKPSGEMWSIGEKVRFVTEYAYRLFQRQGELIDGRRREPIFQILDEAARYIPQSIPAGDNQGLANCLAAWNQLVEEGRNIGIGVGLLTQRSARMAKSVSEIADVMFSFRIVGPNSLGAITDWLGEHVPKEKIRSMVETIRSLDRGHCLIVSPGWLKFEDVVTIDLRATFDSSATPKPGERARKVHGKGAMPDLTKYAERMRATIEKAKESDPRELRKQIAEPLSGKEKGMSSVLQSWLSEIPIRMQSTLVLGLRGPDTHCCPNVKKITRWIRGLTFRPGNPDNVREFMGELPPRIAEKSAVAKELEFCTQHYYSHLMHALEVVGYRHPDIETRKWAFVLFQDMCALFHLPEEDAESMERRLCTREWPSGTQPDTFDDALEQLGVQP